MYLHQNLRPHIQILFSWIHGQVTHCLGFLVSRVSLARRHPAVLRWVAVVLTLVIQAVLLYTLAELIDLCISLMEVWAELASHHIAMTGHE